MRTLKLIKGRILLEYLESKFDIQSSIIYIPDIARLNVQMAKVASISPDTHKYTILRTGDYCLVEKLGTGFEYYDTELNKTFLNTDCCCCMVKLNKGVDSHISDITPLNDRILVEPLPESVGRDTGLIEVAHEEDSKVSKGFVISSGPGDYKSYHSDVFIPTEVKAKETIVYNTGAGQGFKIGDKMYVVMFEKEIMCAVSD